MSVRGCLARLRHGPASNQELADYCRESGGYIARDMSKLIKAGRAVRVDGGSGRGSRAIYALAQPAA